MGMLCRPVSRPGKALSVDDSYKVVDSSNTSALPQGECDRSD